MPQPDCCFALAAPSFSQSINNAGGVKRNTVWQLLQCMTTLVLVQRPQNPGVESIVISFAQKTFANGQLTSKLHVIELGAPAGKLFIRCLLA